MTAAVGALLSPALALAGVFKKKPKVAAPVVPLTPPVAQDRSSSVLAERIAARRGTQTNRRGGGGEALGGTRTTLGSGG